MVNLRDIRHGFHASGNHHITSTGLETLRSEHDSLHTRGAHLVDGGGLSRERATGTKGGLAGGRLADVGLENVSHVDLLDLISLNA